MKGQDVQKQESTALPIAYVSLRILIVLNIIYGAAVLGLLVATVLREQWTFKALGITDASGIPGMIGGLRIIAVLGIVAILFNHLILKRLLAMVDTVRTGDPFVAANAYRLHTIAWIMAGLQLISIGIAAIGKYISTAEYPLHLDAGFSTSGWLAVVLMFVLARVFAEGTLMRADLEGTI